LGAFDYLIRAPLPKKVVEESLTAA
jgi:hypothetical protein